MKILGVKFKNINSLTGEWEIRFDQSPISDTGLFAIVGPNGSGKSSILDAITLGLYGETARLGSPEPVMPSRQGKESYTEVTFSVMDHCYCSRWSLQRSDDTSSSPDMALFSLNGEKTLMESRSIPVRNRIAELTGLDFKRFCRSILLAQGEFSAFLHALENERAEILEKIIGPEMLSEMAASIRTQAQREAERLNRLTEEAAAFQTPDRTQDEDIREFIELAQDEIRTIDQELEMLRDMESWQVRMAQEPLALEHADEALSTAETRYAEARKRFDRLERARPAGLYTEALTRMELLKARAETIQEQVLLMQTQTPAEADRLDGLETQLNTIRSELEAAKQRLSERSEDITGAASLDQDISDTSALFLKTVSRLEAIAREQRDTARMQSEQEETEKKLVERVQDIGQWIEANAADASLDTEIPALESLLNQIIMNRQEIETNRKLRNTAQKSEERSAKALQHAESAVLKVQSNTDALKERKSLQDVHLQAIYAGETHAGLKAVIDHDIKILAACKHIARIAKKSVRFKNVPDELVAYQTRMETLTDAIFTEQSRLQELEGQILQRNTIRRFDSERSLLKSGDPCPLCGASYHPFLEYGMLDFSELDVIVREREEKIHVFQTERDSLEKKGQALLARGNVLDDFKQEWSGLCTTLGESWDFGDKISPGERIQTIRKEIRRARSRIRSAWWYTWQVKWADRRLGRKQEKLAKQRNLLDQILEQRQIHLNETARIDAELIRLDENGNTARIELGSRLERLQQTLPESGSESLPVERLKERLENYRSRLQERTTAADELQQLREQWQSVSEAIDRLQAESAMLSTEGESIQKRLNALKSDRESRYGVLDPAGERSELESRVESLTTEEITLSRNVDSLRVRISADREALERLRDQVQQIRQEAETAEQNLLNQSKAVGFDSLDAIREGLSILQGEQDVTRDLADADTARAAAHQALTALQPKNPTPDSLDTLRWKISDALKRHKELTQEIDSGERTREQNRQAERAYRELLQAVAIQENAYAEAMAVQKSIEGHGSTGGNLHDLLMHQLLEETNRHLMSLSSSRYTLKPSGDNGKGLLIEDAFQSKELRPVKTLSGGESFLVSLCLALGLSNMAAQRHKIESLFLDEGFGALDDEMLYKVMSALKNLRADGKTVGIVSHVKRLAQEIPTQIRLEREPGGSSRITVVA